jgi:hypothetical protein
VGRSTPLAKEVAKEEVLQELALQESVVPRFKALCSKREATSIYPKFREFLIELEGVL